MNITILFEKFLQARRNFEARLDHRAAQNANVAWKNYVSERDGR